MDSEEFVNRIIMSISSIEPQSKSDLRCAPGLEYTAGSCASLAVLEEMARSYNITANEKDKIRISENIAVLNPQKYKLYLVHEIEKRIGDKCKKQKCWTTQDFVKKMSDVAREELLKYTFRPESPQGQFEWLSTFNINDTMKQYERKYDGFKFYGALPIDFADISKKCSYCRELNDEDYGELCRRGITKIGIVFNLDEHYKNGSHWVALYSDLDKGHIFYFDSFGVPPNDRINTLMRKHARFLTKQQGFNLAGIRSEYNKVQHQKDNTECGVYSMNFLIRMVRGDDFDELCNDPIDDNKMNKCRKIYFDKCETTN